MTDRPIAGRLRFSEPVEPGTIMGPMWTREFVVALHQDEEGKVVFGYAQKPEIDTAMERMAAGEPPRSLLEASWRSTQNGIRMPKGRE